MNRFTDKQKVLLRHLVEVEGVSVRDALTFVAEELDNDYEIDRQTCPHVVNCGEREFTVYNDLEADRAEDNWLDGLLDDMLSNVPDNLRIYFDEDRWKDDAKMDGRGSALNGWDGQEWVYEIDGEQYFVYKN